nr:alpha-(1,6)-fucosyltransferase-like [Penaeus vannamei]
MLMHATSDTEDSATQNLCGVCSAKFEFESKASGRAHQEQLKEVETDSDAAGEGEGRPPNPDPSSTRPFLSREGTHKLYRQVESDIFYARQFVVAKLRHFIGQITDKEERERLAGVVEDLKHNFRVTQYDLWRLGNVSGLHDWQKGEVQALNDLIQHRIHVLQNPPDCKSAKKITCRLPVHLKGVLPVLSNGIRLNKESGISKTRGACSQLHHLTYCFLAAYGTQRTLVISEMHSYLDMSSYFLPVSATCAKAQWGVRWPGLGIGNAKAQRTPWWLQFPDTDRPVPRPNYLPRSVPRDFAERLASFHGDPFAWWMGQFMKYAMRMNRGFQEAVEKLGARLGFEGPVVGVQVRRTDKLLHDSRLIGLEEYMEAVDDFYNDLEVRGTTVTTRKVYLATDDPQVLKEAKEKFPRHAFVFNEESVASASMRQRRSDANMRNLMSDVYFLSRSDFLVCGMSSNICRLAYELMQTLHADATWRVFSVDSPYWFHYQSGHEVEARLPHTPRRSGEITLQKGDRVKGGSLKQLHIRKRHT